jgi:beta-galactosidase
VLPALKPGQECHLNLHFRAAAATPWCAAGHEVAWEQFALPVVPTLPAAPPRSAGKVACRARGALTTVSVGPLKVVVDHIVARVESVSWDGHVVLAAGPELNLWRATTDNDGIRGWNGQDWKPMGLWLAAGLNELRVSASFNEIAMAGDDAVITLERTYLGKDPAKPARHVQVLRVTPSGDIWVENTVDVDRGLPSLPRIGVSLQTPAGFERVEWFGRGPHENHIDRNAGAPVGRYVGTVDEQFVPYVLPQENGNKTEVRWFQLDDGGVGVRFAAPGLCEFSVRHFTGQDLFRCYHLNDLPDVRRAETVICLDHRQRGVGTGSCGPQTLPKYCVEPGVYRFAYVITPFGLG